MTPPIDSEQQAQLQRALVFMEANLENAITVDEIARVACYTARHFQRLFREHTGETVHDHLRRLRAERAAVLLRYLDHDVTSTALAVGFHNSSGLYKAIRWRFGCAPDALRRENGATSSPPPFRVREHDQPAMRLAFLRHVGDPKQSLRVWLRLLEWARSEKLIRPGAMLAGVNHDSTETDATRWRYDACITLPQDYQPRATSGITVQELPGGLTLMHDFHGTLAGLEARWHMFTEVWFPRTQWRLRDGRCYDLYPAAEATLAKIASLLVNPRSLIRSTLCIPVELRPKS